MPCFKERCRQRPTVTPSPTLPKSVITHRFERALVRQKGHVVEPRSQLGNFSKVFDFNRLFVYHELSPNLRHRFHPHRADFLPRRKMLHDFVQVDLTLFCKDE